MKKSLLCALTTLAGLSLFAQKGADELLFLDPHVKELEAKGSALCVNVGKNIPSTTHFMSDNVCKVVGLGAYFEELSSGMEKEAYTVVTAPASYGVVFTDGSSSLDEVYHHIAKVLEKIGSSQDEALISSELNALTEVYRASFVRRGERLVLVTDEKGLVRGEAIWRKTPEGSEKNIYHSEEEYLIALKSAGFFVEEIKRPCFFGEVKWNAYNSSLAEGATRLGEAYKENHPFTIFIVKKI